MKKIYCYIPVLLTCLLAGISCSDDDVEVLDGPIVFELYAQDGALINSGDLITMGFNETAEFRIVGEFVSYQRINAPEGWVVSFIVSSGYGTITAPALGNLDAEAGGTLTVELESMTGRTATSTYRVGALEEGLELAFTDPEVGEQTVTFAFAASRTFDITTSKNVVDLDITKPGDWSASYDLDAGTVTVTAPPVGQPDPTEEAVITITPVSIRGSVGEGITVPVRITTDVPVVTFDQDTYTFDFGESFTIAYQKNMVNGLSVDSYPEGWTVTLDEPNNRISVTAPEESGTYVGSDLITLRALANGGHTEDYSVGVRLWGINTSDEFIRFGEAVESNGDLTPYMKEGKVILTGDIDLTGSDKDIFVPGTYNRADIDGRGRTVKIDITAAGNRAGLFEIIDNCTIVNMRIEGTINSAAAFDQTIGGLAALNNGAAIENITTDIDYTLTAFRHSSPGNPTNSPDAYGSIVGLSDAATYTDCVSYGTITISGGLYNGGQIGSLIVGSVGTIQGCENNVSITTTRISTEWTNASLGGIVGNSRRAAWTFENCTNNGDITIEVASGILYYGAGGIVGTAYGQLRRCKNYGNISTNGVAVGDRRAGGIVGASGWGGGTGLRIIIEDCENHGDISVPGAYVSGIAGIVQQSTAGPLITNCLNTGAITNPASSGTAQLSGIVSGALAGGTYTNCINRGKISGTLTQRGAGIVARVGSAATFVGCENHADLEFNYSGSNNKYAAGLVVVMANVAVTIQDCKNSGTITVPAAVNGVSTHSIYTLDGTSPITIDQATIEYCEANTTIVMN